MGLDKLLTIIIPHKNDVDRLTKLLNQIEQLGIHQCIIIDDGSNPENDPFFLLNDFPNFLFLKNIYGMGAGGARNTGLDAATGEWLLFVDSDDTLLVKEFKLIDLNEISDFDIVFFGPTSHYDGTNVPSHRHKTYSDLVNNYISYNEETYETELRYKFVIPTSKLIKRQLLEDHQIRFEESMYANDQVFSIKVGYYAKKIRAVSTPLYSISYREASLTKDYTLYSLNIRFNEYMKGVRFLKDQMPHYRFKQLDFSYEAKGFLMKALIYGRSPKTFLEYYKLLKINKIRIIRFNDLNPFSRGNHVIRGLRKMMINRRSRVK